MNAHPRIHHRSRSDRPRFYQGAHRRRGIVQRIARASLALDGAGVALFVVGLVAVTLGFSSAVWAQTGRMDRAQTDAASPSRVVIVEYEPEDGDVSAQRSRAPRLTAELTYAGYEVVFERLETGGDPLEAVARSVVDVEVVAGIWLAPRREIVWVSTAAPEGDDVLVREVSIVEDDPEFVAFRVVELVQASLQGRADNRLEEAESSEDAASMSPADPQVPAAQGRWRCSVTTADDGTSSTRCDEERELSESSERVAAALTATVDQEEGRATSGEVSGTGGPREAGDAVDASVTDSDSESDPEPETDASTGSDLGTRPRGDLTMGYGYRWGTHYDLGVLSLQGTARLGRRRQLMMGLGASWAGPAGAVDAGAGDSGTASDSVAPGAIRVRQVEALALVGVQGRRGRGDGADALRGSARLSGRLVVGLGVATLLGENTDNGRQDRTTVARAMVQPGLDIWITRGLSMEIGGTLELSAPGVSVLGGVGGGERGVVAGGLRAGLRWTWGGGG